MLTSLFTFCNNLGRRIKQWIKPTTVTLIVASLTDMTRSKADLIAENAMLRQQLIVLNRQIKRPQLTNGDRLRLVLLARCTQFWQQALHIVQPDTLLRWHRELFRLYWRYKSRNKNREPRITQEVIDLIRALSNRYLNTMSRIIRLLRAHHRHARVERFAPRLLPHCLLTLTFPQIRSTTKQATNRVLMACLGLIALLISGVGSEFLLSIARPVCFFLRLLVDFSTRNSPQIGEFRVENPRFLGG